MKREIKTSVIIPIHNTAKYLDECIQSVLNQTQKKIEIILVDDGSTDNSGEIANKYEQKYENIIVIHQNNKKPGGARNTGVKNARGKYIYFLDSDDYISPDLLEMCYIHASKNKLDFLFFDAFSFCTKEEEKKLSPDINFDRSQKNIKTNVFNGKDFWTKYASKGGVNSCPPLIYIKKEYIESKNIFFEEGMFYEDLDWIVRMYRNAERVCYFPHKLYYRRCRLESIMQSQYSVTHFYSAERCFWNLFKLYEEYEDIESKQMAEHCLYSMIARLQIIVRSMETEVIYQNIFNLFIAILKKEKINILNDKLYIEIFKLEKTFSNYIDLNNSKNIKKEYCEYCNNFIKFVRGKYKLEENINIGIYGIGKMCDEIFDWYEKKQIPINANIKFIVTKRQTETYKGYPVYELEQIRAMKLDYIIIASIKFAEDMEENLRKYDIKSKGYFKTFSILSDI